MKKTKINKKKFISRVSIVIIFFAIFIICINGILKTDKDSISDFILILDAKDVTSELKKDAFINKDGILYIEIDDIRNLFDSNLFYEETSNKIITTSGTKVAAIDIGANTMELNSASLSLTSGSIKTEAGIFLPLSELTNIYNIDVKTNSKSALVFSLYKALTTVNTTKSVSLKLSESFFSKTIQKLDKNQEVIFLEDSEKSGWIKVLTYEGNIGYLKENDVGEKNRVRIDMEESDFSSKEADEKNSIEINYNTLTQGNLKDFSARKNIVQDIISKILSKEKFTVSINMNNVQCEEEYLKRFIIELIPRLKEIGAKLIISNNSILDSIFLEEKSL